MLKNALLQCDLRRVNIISRYLLLAFVFGILFLYPNHNPVHATILGYQLTDTATSTIPVGSPYFKSYDLSQATGNSTQLNFGFKVGYSSAYFSQIKACIQQADDINFTQNVIYIATWKNGDTSGCPYRDSGTPNMDLYDATNTLKPYNLNETFAYGTYYFLATSTWANEKFYRIKFEQGGDYTFSLKALNSDIIYYVMADTTEEALYGFQNTIAITYPPNATSTPDFGNFLLNWYALTPASTYVWVGYGATSTAWTFTDESGAGTENQNTNVVFPKMNLLNQGSYYAQAKLFEYDANYNKIYLATSSLISFDILAGTYIPFFYPTPTSTASSTEWSFTCDPESGFFANSLCMLAQFLFMPKQEDFNKFNDLKAALENKPPVGYFYLIKNSLLGLNSSSSAAFNLPQDASLSDYIFNPVRNGISFILWLIFGFWVFNRIRHLQL